MGKAVNETLIELMQKEGVMDSRQALSYIDSLQNDLRYHEEVYWFSLVKLIWNERIGKLK